MSDSIRKISRARQYIIAILLPILLFCLCISTAFNPRNLPSDTVATISKTKIEAQASREEITKRLVNIWMGKYRIGTIGWLDWIWKYKIDKIEFWDTTSSCVNVYIKVLPVLPSERTLMWDGKKVEGWINISHTMVLSTYEDYYELSGPYSLC